MSRFFLLTVSVLLCVAAGAARADDFKGFPCESDCPAYIEGYVWAGKNAGKIMERPSLCNKEGRRQFALGCMYWFAERHVSSCYRMETLIAGGKTEDIYDLYEEFCL